MVVSSPWCEETAKSIALSYGIKRLKAEHWLIILYLRDYYKDFQCSPSIRKICLFTRLSTLEIYHLFPQGAISSAWAIAGLPPLKGCI